MSRFSGRIFKGLKEIDSFLKTPVFFGKSLKNAPPGSLVVFPYRENVLCCGLAGMIAYKQRTHAPAEGLDALIAQMEKAPAGIESHKLESILANGGLDASYLGGDLLTQLMEQVQTLKKHEVFCELFSDQALKERVTKVSSQLTQLAGDEDKALSICVSLSAVEMDLATDRLELLKDIAWRLSSEVLGALAGVTALMGDDASNCQSCAADVYFQVHSVLSSIDRLEVRGRDSSGISLLFFMTPEDFGAWKSQVAEAGLSGELESRSNHKPVLLNNGMAVRESENQAAVSITYKVAAEIGRLGDNTAFLREQVQRDKLLALLACASMIHFTVNAHTRWASVGAITEPNCHPVDNAVEGAASKGLIYTCLNGDIDNYAELKAAYEARTGAKIPEDITTDTKIIPLQIEKYIQKGHKLETAFRLAVNDFSGSHAIFMHTSLAPGKFFMAQRGSGQTVFVGIGDEAYMPTSEVYGFVEHTQKFIKLQGEKEVEGVSGITQGQVFVLDQAKGGVEGVTACYYDGTPLPLSDSDLQSTEITTRDTDRQGFDHYFLKEISEAPLSVERTMRNRWRIVKEGGAERIIVDLDSKIVPDSLANAFKNGEIEHVYFIGQGTAGIAAQACADIFKYYMKNSLKSVSAQKASEFSGFMLHQGDDKDSLKNTLVVAISQSGTTTDTNRTVDMVKSRGAHTLAIVNRRDSDITFKVDGVLYTSSGRDIEMSVASTKAFYSQIVAGALLGLHMARLTNMADDAFVAQEIRNLLAVPDSMRRVLANKEAIAASARALAVTKTYWASVGSGPNKAAADEIRIKLSELCYKTISSDYVEDKKHIDLSSEPLILVCAAGSPEEVLGDIIKDTAIFKAHKAAPVVIADEGENRFNDYAEFVIGVPGAPPHLAPILSTLAGHIWGYNAALALNQGSEFLFKFREKIRNYVENAAVQDQDVYELLLDQEFRESVAMFYQEFRKRILENSFPAGLCGTVPADLTLLAKYLEGRLRGPDFTIDFGVKGTPSNMLNKLFSTLSFGINQLARPVDAIKHQAKTVTVGTSRIAEKAEGLLFESVCSHGFSPDQLINKNVLVLRNLQEVVAEILGSTLYSVQGLSLLGEPTEKSTITILQKRGSSQSLPSRVENDTRLKGTKSIIVREGNVYIGLGRKDNRSLIFIPVISGSGPSPNVIEHLLLLHVDFKKDLSLEKIIRALGGKYERIKNLVQESSVTWQDDFLGRMDVEFIFGRSAEKIAEAIVSREKE
ncbi:SIS domain-containing protein [Desulfatibacillum aliphaticivorans]|uniref:SIS domain-containing protein n=1 Tax=Desulfatibacillum aliphaticivorans TaxID=218208 RepID=UPI00041F3150|nr:SIS domain-containing protein [Desulfatibacillum aliphaticivorans]